MRFEVIPGSWRYADQLDVAKQFTSGLLTIADLRKCTTRVKWLVPPMTDEDWVTWANDVIADEASHKELDDAFDEFMND